MSQYMAVRRPRRGRAAGAGQDLRLYAGRKSHVGRNGGKGRRAVSGQKERIYNNQGHTLP